MRIVAGTFKNRPIASPKGLQTRPTSSQLREALFNISQSYISGAFFLDLFAGSGAMGLEALSRGAIGAVFVDESRASVKCIRENLAELQIEEQAQVICKDVFSALKIMEKAKEQYDIIYADPPYDRKFHGEQTYGEKVIEVIDQSDLLKPNGFLFVEDSSNSKFGDQELKNLKLISVRKMGRSTLHQFRRES